MSQKKTKKSTGSSAGKSPVKKTSFAKKTAAKAASTSISSRSMAAAMPSATPMLKPTTTTTTVKTTTSSVSSAKPASKPMPKPASRSASGSASSAKASISPASTGLAKTANANTRQMFDFAAQAASKVLNNTLSAVSQKDMDTFWGNWNDGFSTAFLECEKVLNMVKEQVTNMTNTTLFCNCDDFMTMGKTGFDAYVSACNTWAKGLETISKNWMAYIQQSLEKNMSMMKAISSCKNPQEVFTLQNDWAKSCMDNFMAESNKMSEMSVKTANEAFKPLQTTMNTCMNQVTSSFGTLTKKAA